MAELETTGTRAVYVRLTDADVATTRVAVTDDVIVDYDATGRPLGVEILGAQSVTIGGHLVPRPPQPEVVTLCGSMRFLPQMLQVAAEETTRGAIVMAPFSVVAPEDQGSDFKAMLDELHRRKIEMADRVVVVTDETGYYGTSTAAEIAYATELEKPVTVRQVRGEPRRTVPDVQFRWRRDGKGWAVRIPHEPPSFPKPYTPWRRYTAENERWWGDERTDSEVWGPVWTEPITLDELVNGPQQPAGIPAEVREEWAAWDPTHTDDPNDEAARTRRLRDQADAEDYVLMPMARRNRIAYRAVTYSRWAALPGMDDGRG